jgi:hypothetical protein
MSNLKDAFDDMMAKRGKPTTKLPPPEMSKKWNHHNRLAINSSEVNIEDIHPEVARMVRCAYAADLCLLGFDPITGRDLDSALIDTGCSL